MLIIRETIIGADLTRKKLPKNGIFCSNSWCWCKNKSSLAVLSNL